MTDMKSNKQFTKIIDNLMETAFKKDGNLDQKQVESHVKALKSLPIPDSIIALSEYLRRIKFELNKTTLEIETSIPLSQSQIKQITDAVKVDHQISAVKSTINPSILGGLRVKIGDVVYDDSIARRILQLGEEIRS